MTYRPLGRTGLQVSRLGLGTSVLARKAAPDDVPRIIRAALDAGINLIDTANIYGRGDAERMVGNALHDLGCRENVLVATKLHGRMHDTDPNQRGSSRRHIIEQCEGSLRRLRTDYIDLYQLHRPEPSTPIDETLRAFDDLVRQGKVRYVGTSVFPAWKLIEALWASREHRLVRFATEQPPYHLLDRRIERELVPMARTHGLGLITWSPLAGGMLTGRYSREAPDAAEGRLNDENWFSKRSHFVPAAFNVVDRLAQLAEARGCTAAQVAIAWANTRPGVTCTLIGNRTPDQLRDNLAALTIELTDAECAALDAVAPPGRASVPYYDDPGWAAPTYR